MRSDEFSGAIKKARKNTQHLQSAPLYPLIQKMGANKKENWASTHQSRTMSSLMCCEGQTPIKQSIFSTVVGGLQRRKLGFIFYFQRCTPNGAKKSFRKFWVFFLIKTLYGMLLLVLDRSLRYLHIRIPPPHCIAAISRELITAAVAHKVHGRAPVGTRRPSGCGTSARP